MSYDVSFKFKVEGVDWYEDTGLCDVNTTWNLRKMIVKSSGLAWENEANNGYVKDIIPNIEKGLKKLKDNPAKYAQYNAPNGWGTVDGLIRFYEDILQSWEWVKEAMPPEAYNRLTFWIQ